MSHDSGATADVTSVASIEQRLRHMGAQVSSWSNGPGDRYLAHEHGYDKIVVAMQGAVTFLLPATGRSIELRASDRLDLPQAPAMPPRSGRPASDVSRPTCRPGVWAPIPNVWQAGRSAIRPPAQWTILKPPTGPGRRYP